MCSLSLVVRELDFIFAGFLVVHITRVTPLEACDLIEGDVVTLLGNVKNLTRDPDFLRIQRVLFRESQLIQRKAGWSKRVTYLGDTFKAR